MNSVLGRMVKRVRPMTQHELERILGVTWEIVEDYEVVQFDDDSLMYCIKGKFYHVKE